MPRRLGPVVIAGRWRLPSAPETPVLMPFLPWAPGGPQKSSDGRVAPAETVGRSFA